MPQKDRHRRIPHVCPSCGAVRRLKPADAAKTRICRRCHCIEIAPLGFAATAAKYGRDFAILAAASKRRAQPSSLERQVEAALRTIPGIAWERESPVERPNYPPYFVDFVVVVGTKRVALEVNGSFAHRDDGSSSERIEALRQHFSGIIILNETTLHHISDLAVHLMQLLHIVD